MLVELSRVVNLPLHHEFQKFSSGTGSPGGPGKKYVKRLWCGVVNSFVSNSNCLQTCVWLWQKRIMEFIDLDTLPEVEDTVTESGNCMLLFLWNQDATL